MAPRGVSQGRELVVPRPADAVDNPLPHDRERGRPPIQLTDGQRLWPRRMVHWYSLGQLARTTRDLVFSRLMARHFDLRVMMQTAPSDSGDRIELARVESRDFGFDWVADTGDGFDSTYCVARCVALPALTLQGSSGDTLTLPSADMVLFGGDLCYPVGSPETYRQRFVGPWLVAAPRPATPDGPVAVALPGNHDWYETLSGFRETFTRGDDFAAWRTVQTRSYFATELGPGRKLFALDLQLAGDIDEQQLRWFVGSCKGLQSGERIVLACGTPFWLHGNQPPPRVGALVAAIEQAGGEVTMYIAGDRHHYQRFEAAGIQYVTCGGGGAFLHPTHTHQDHDTPAGATRATDYPDVDTSRRLGWRNLLFAWHNRDVWQLIAVICVLLGTLLSDRALTVPGIGSLPLWRALRSAELLAPFSALFMVALAFGIAQFGGPPPGGSRMWPGSVLHGIGQVLCLFAAWVLAATLVPGLGGNVGGMPGMELILRLLVFTLGFIAIATLLCGTALGLYLALSVRFAGRHANEAFSSLRVADFKSFIRFRLTADGRLVGYVIGIDRVPRIWRPVTTSNSPLREPDDPRATEPRLIEWFEVL